MTEPGGRPARTLVIVPTYNERESLPDIAERLRAAVPTAHLLVADDASPDGTGQIAEHMAAEDDHVHVLHRPGKQGLGAAYLDGFDWALRHGFEVVVEMDADGSHAPEELHRLLERLAEGADVCIGARYVPGGKVVNWPKHREWLSRGGNVYSRLMLGVHLHDVTAGYRAFTADALRRIDLSQVQSQGYCFQVDLMWRAVRAGLRVDEVPVTFVERVQGVSKMSRSIVAEALWRVTVWGVGYRWQRLTGRAHAHGAVPSA